MAPVTSKPGTVDVFWQGPGRDLWHVYTTDGCSTWSALANLGMGPLVSTPFGSAGRYGSVDVFWRGSGNVGGELYPTL
jgi:hypothetical protein